MLFILRGRLFNPTSGKRERKRTESHLYEVNTLWKLACNFSTFLRFLEGNFLENRLQNLTEVTDFSQEKF